MSKNICARCGLYLAAGEIICADCNNSCKNELEGLLKNMECEHGNAAEDCEKCKDNEAEYLSMAQAKRDELYDDLNAQFIEELNKLGNTPCVSDERIIYDLDDLNEDAQFIEELNKLGDTPYVSDDDGTTHPFKKASDFTWWNLPPISDQTKLDALKIQYRDILGKLSHKDLLKYAVFRLNDVKDLQIAKSYVSDSLEDEN